MNTIIRSISGEEICGYSINNYITCKQPKHSGLGDGKYCKIHYYATTRSYKRLCKYCMGWYTTGTRGSRVCDTCYEKNKIYYTKFKRDRLVQTHAQYVADRDSALQRLKNVLCGEIK